MGILRLLLAMAVIAAHAGSILGFRFVGSPLAVESFYMISGFYMSLILRTKYNSYSIFITNRLFKLYPTYWIVALLTIILSLFIGFYTHGKSQGELTAYYSYWKSLQTSTKVFFVLVNIIIFLQDLTLFTAVDPSGGLYLARDFKTEKIQSWQFLLVPQAWSIGLELLFYLLIPFLVKKKNILLILLVVASLSIKFYLGKHYGLTNDPWSYRFFPSEIGYFFLGVLANRIYFYIQPKMIPRAIQVFAFALVALLTLFYDRLFDYSEGYFLVYQVILFCAMPFIFLLTKDWKLDRSIGELSYPIYLCHWMIISLLSGFTNRLHFNLNNGFAVTVVSILFSLLVNRYLIRRIEVYRQKRVLKYQVV